ncbi:hypothetical protein Tco_0055750, partial [Tanacetum coccineum]
GPRYEVGESSTAAAARPAGGLRNEIVETLQGAPVSTDIELGAHMREFESMVRRDTDEIYMRLDDEQGQRQLLAGRRLGDERWMRAILLIEVQDHDAFVDHMDEYHEYVEDNEEHVVQCNASSVRNGALMSILDEMHEQGIQSRLTNKPDMVMNDKVTSELARYKELVGEYEKRAKFELTDRERKIDEQMRIIISDRNRKETSLKSELHSTQILLSSTVGHYKSKTEEVIILKKEF